MKNPRPSGVWRETLRLQNRGQLSLEFYVLNLEGLESGAVVGSVEVSAHDKECIVTGISNAGVFGGGIGCGEGLPYYCGFVNVHHNFSLLVFHPRTLYPFLAQSQVLVIFVTFFVTACYLLAWAENE